MTRVVVAAPYCTPGRVQVLTALKPYHYRLALFAVQERLVRAGGKPLHWRVSVDFTPQSAEWGEYMLIRQGFGLLSRPINPKNLVWGNPARHGYAPPPPWGNGHVAWRQAGCHETPKPEGGAKQPARNGWMKRLQKIFG